MGTLSVKGRHEQLDGLAPIFGRLGIAIRATVKIFYMSYLPDGFQHAFHRDRLYIRQFDCKVSSIYCYMLHSGLMKQSPPQAEALPHMS